MNKIHQQSFYNSNVQGLLSDGVGPEGISTSAPHIRDTNSPDPQGTLHGVHHHNQNHMMLIDSTTPMFTSEFTIMPAPTMLMGGIDTSLGVPHNLINEWNPM
jgi:hypothetical protein